MQKCAARCHGRRFTRDARVRYRDHDISQVLDLTVEEALELFKGVPPASRAFECCRTSAGYLQSGSPPPRFPAVSAARETGEELGRRARAGVRCIARRADHRLHLADTARLLGVLRRLVDAAIP